ncbi:hypothetical protein FQR65_LT04130 [Abscondita terminalis]|nr:hypothetical protein FQR65_LT04130 [Abscondita terminalis]
MNFGAETISHRSTLKTPNRTDPHLSKKTRSSSQTQARCASGPATATTGMSAGLATATAAYETTLRHESCITSPGDHLWYHPGRSTANKDDYTRGAPHIGDPDVISTDGPRVHINKHENQVKMPLF